MKCRWQSPTAYALTITIKHDVDHLKLRLVSFLLQTNQPTTLTILSTPRRFGKPPSRAFRIYTEIASRYLERSRPRSRTRFPKDTVRDSDGIRG